MSKNLLSLIIRYMENNMLAHFLRLQQILIFPSFISNLQCPCSENPISQCTFWVKTVYCFPAYSKCVVIYFVVLFRPFYIVDCSVSLFSRLCCCCSLFSPHNLFIIFFVSAAKTLNASSAFLNSSQLFAF